MRLSIPKLPWPLVMVKKLFTSHFGSQNAGQYSIRSLKSVLQIVKTTYGVTTEVSFLSHMSLYLPMPGDIQFPEATPLSPELPRLRMCEIKLRMFACEHEKRDECVCHMCNA